MYFDLAPAALVVISGVFKWIAVQPDNQLQLSVVAVLF